MVQDLEIINSLGLLEFIEEMLLVHKTLLLEEPLVNGLICLKTLQDQLPTVSYTLNPLNNELSTVTVMHSQKMVKRVMVADLVKSQQILAQVAIIWRSSQEWQSQSSEERWKLQRQKTMVFQVQECMMPKIWTLCRALLL